MPYQNRITPNSAIESHSARGMFMGNRGILHNEKGVLVTQKWRHKSWVICNLVHKDWHRKILQPNHYTELFFLDELTALSAGHRPCALCRNKAYKKFIHACGFQKAKDMDTVLHAERKGNHFDDDPYPVGMINGLPNGGFFQVKNDDAFYLKWNDRSWRWSHQGYSPVVKKPGQHIHILTPALSLKALKSGYQPITHPSLPDGK